MILLVTAMERREEYAAALQKAMGEPVVIAENLFRATTLLRTNMYRAAVFDEQLGQSEPVIRRLSQMLAKWYVIQRGARLCR